MAEAPATTPAPAGTTEAAQQTPTAPERPAWLPEKFKTPEDMAKSYEALEKRFSNPVERAKPPDGTPQIPTAPAVPELADDAGIAAIVERAGLKEADIVKAWQEKGELTDEQYAAFKKSGIPKGAVKEFLAAQSAIGKQIVQASMKEALDFVGGEEQHKNLLAWAGNGGITAQEVDAMNAELAADPTRIGAITRDLYARHIKLVGAGKAQPLLSGESAPSGGGPYKSQEEIAKVVNSPEYQAGDPVVMAAHRERLKLTPHEVIRRW